MKANYYLLTLFISSYKKSLSTFFFVFLTSMLWGQTFNTSGTWTLTVPGVTSVTVEAWGGGGAGRPLNAQNAGGGGGSGGGYVKATFPVVFGNSYPYTVGAGGAGSSGGNGGDTFFINASTIKAVGGNGAGGVITTNNTWTTGANAPTTGNVVGGSAVLINNAYGGKGGNASSTNRDSGGGGSSAGNGNNNGNDANLINAGAAPINGYAGGAGRDNTNPGISGGIGAGGGGARRGNSGSGLSNGGNGGNGQIKLSYISVTNVTPNPVCVGSTITITGTNFLTTGTTTVSINGTACTGVTVVNTTTITAVVAAGTTSGTVVINNPNGTNNGQSITVNPLPTAVTVTGTTPACTSTTLTASNGSSGTIYWQGTTSNGTSTATPSTSQVVSVSGTYYFRARSAAGCWGPQGSITVVINTPPAAIGGGAAAVCVGATTPAFTNSTAGGVWSIINGTGSASITSGGVVTGLTAGNVTVAYTVGSCPAVTQSLTVNPAPSAIGGGSSTVCVGSTTPAFTNSVGGGTWSISNGTGSASITAGGVVTGGSAGSVTVVYTIGTCSVSAPITVIATPTITANPSNVSIAAGANASFTVAASNAPSTYTWQVSTDGGTSWTTVSNGGVYSNATSATLNITGATFGMNDYLYRASATNACGTSAYSSNAKLTVDYCTPTFTSSNIGKLYVESFKFIGVLNDDLQVANVSTQSGTNGVYENFTTLTPIAEQVRGSVVNIEAICNGTFTSNSIVGWGYWMAWVDWNRDGTFDDATERVYALQDYLTKSVTFGFVITPDKPLGDYRIRISTMSKKSTNPCGLSSAYGEVEDYLFRVVEDNEAKLDTSKPDLFNRCGDGDITLQVYGDTNAAGFNWYSAKYGGTLLHSGDVNTGSVFTTYITGTTPYYVAVVDGNGKETPFRYPIIARKDPVPEVYFTPTPETICGEDDPSLLLNVWGDNREVVLFDEKFSSGLGVFDTQSEDTNVSDGSAFTGYSYIWKTEASPLEQKNPPHLAIASSISSGYFGGNFAIMNSDGADRLGGKNIKRHLYTINTYNTIAFLPSKLYLDFDLYYFSIALLEADGYFNVEYSLDGANWTKFKTFVLNQGNPLFWSKNALDLDALGVPRSANIKFRFSLFSRGLSSGGYFENVATLDNVKLWGSIPVDRDYEWSGIDAGVLYDQTCTTPLGSNWARTVCVKPPIDEFEKPYWDLYASATFQGGCPAIGSTRVYNDTKIWNQPGKTDWKQANDWKPLGTPDIKKCVIVRTPVDLPQETTGSHGLARSVIVKPGGSLAVNPQSSLTIQNYIKNEAAAADVVVDNDANLIQVNNAAVNIGDITVKRSANLKRLDYNYWGAPVTGQNLRTFSPGTLSNRFYTYNENNDLFTAIDPNAFSFELGKGYAIRASNALSNVASAQMHGFTGVPNNGNISVPVLRTATGRGFNLIANPYPSNFDFEAWYNYGTNSSIIYNTAYFWTNTNYNPKMQGSAYPSNLPSGTQIINNYAILNGTGGVAAPYATGSGNNDPIGSPSNCPMCTTPNQYVKVGQGFIVKVRNEGNFNLAFENNSNIRSNNASSIFFNRVANSNHRSKEETKDRFWVNLKTPLDFVSPILIGYIKGASYAYEQDYDAELLVVGGDSFYTTTENKKLAIQGRYPFNTEDKVSLGTRFGLQGQYEISVANKEGIFANQQPIYLKDHLTGVVTNLSQEKYVFTANAGDTTDRFEIQYTNQGTLNTTELKNKSTVVYQLQNDIIIESPSTIKGVKIYDASGKMVHHSKEKEMKVVISSMKYSSGVYVLEISTEKGVEVRKIVK